MNWRTRRAMRWLFYAVAIGTVVAGLNYVFANRVDPNSVPQSTWHSIATASARGTLDPLPKEHEVVVDPLDESPWVVLASYLPPPLGKGGVAEKQGQYDSKTGCIEITGKMARLQASLPFPWARPTLTRTLRHEYGHAFAHDYLKSKDCAEGGEAFMGFTEPGDKLKANAYPKALRPVAEEFANVESDVYGQEYFTQNFDEYLAESYARFVSGKSVPPKVRKFLQTACEK